MPVGRLDKDSTGLLLLTNDGELTHRLMHPRYEVIKTYEVCATGHFNGEDFDRFKKGIRSEGEVLKVRSIKLLKSFPGKSLMEIKLGEGRKREIRRMMEELGRKTISLKRIDI